MPNNYTNLLSCSDSALQGVVVGSGAGAVPHGDSPGQNAFNGASVERVHNRGRGLAAFSLRRKSSHYWAFLANDVELMFHDD